MGDQANAATAFLEDSGAPAVGGDLSDYEEDEEERGAAGNTSVILLVT